MDSDSATIWVETDAACRVSVHAGQVESCAATFCEPGSALSIVVGYCRAAAPLDDDEGGIDALHALAQRMRYQHLGNLSPTELENDPLLHALQADDGDGEALLRGRPCAPMP